MPIQRRVVDPHPQQRPAEHQREREGEPRKRAETKPRHQHGHQHQLERAQGHQPEQLAIGQAKAAQRPAGRHVLQVFRDDEALGCPGGHARPPMVSTRNSTAPWSSPKLNAITSP